MVDKQNRKHSPRYAHMKYARTLLVLISAQKHMLRVLTGSVSFILLVNVKMPTI